MNHFATPITLLLCFSASVAEEVRSIPVNFEAATDKAVINASVSGRNSVLYKFVGRKGQFLAASMTTDNESSDFNIYIPGRGPGDEALFASAMAAGRQYTGQLYKDGEHTISIFLNRAAARRNEQANFSINIQVSDKAPDGAAAAGDKFSKKVSYDTISFLVTSPATEKGNTFTIASSGLSEVNDAFPVEIQGKVINVVCDDMDGDNSPEVAVITEKGPGDTRTAHVFSSYNRRSFGMVNFQDITDAKQLIGYRGGDEFQFVENSFIRRFPLYSDDKKTGKFRQFQFKMEPGEAMKQLKLERSIDF